MGARAGGETALENSTSTAVPQSDPTESDDGRDAIRRFRTGRFHGHTTRRNAKVRPGRTFPRRSGCPPPPPLPEKRLIYTRQHYTVITTLYRFIHYYCYYYYYVVVETFYFYMVVRERDKEEKEREKEKECVAGKTPENYLLPIITTISVERR